MEIAILILEDALPQQKQYLQNAEKRLKDKNECAIANCSKGIKEIEDAIELLKNNNQVSVRTTEPITTVNADQKQSQSTKKHI